MRNHGKRETGRGGTRLVAGRAHCVRQHPSGCIRPGVNMAFVELEKGRRWADYAHDEPLPEILFGKSMSPAVDAAINTGLPEEVDDGFVLVKRKHRAPAPAFAARPLRGWIR